ncbi:MAG: guanylate kinase [Chlamydiota bacterium]
MVQKLLGNLSKGLCFVISAPAGTGKTTLARKLTQEFSCVNLSVSSTTRAPRVDEVSGVDYIFLSKEEFEKQIEDGTFLEYAKVCGNYYGTSKSQVEKKCNEGKHVVFVIDTQGALQLQERQFSAVFIFVSPPSLEILKERLVKRKTDSIDSIEERLVWAREEMAMADYYDYHIINDDLNVAYEVLRSILIAEEHKLGEI